MVLDVIELQTQVSSRVTLATKLATHPLISILPFTVCPLSVTDDRMTSVLETMSRSNLAEVTSNHLRRKGREHRPQQSPLQIGS